jgi:hypothetical protein
LHIEDGEAGRERVAGLGDKGEIIVDFATIGHAEEEAFGPRQGAIADRRFQAVEIVGG